MRNAFLTKLSVIAVLLVLSVAFFSDSVFKPSLLFSVISHNQIVGQPLIISTYLQHSKSNNSGNIQTNATLKQPSTSTYTSTPLVQSLQSPLPNVENSSWFMKINSASVMKILQPTIFTIVSSFSSKSGSSASSKTSSSSSSTTTSSTTSTPTSTPPLTPPPFTYSSRMFVGYYGGWAAYSGYTPDKINASNIDILEYAFATIGSDLKITASDSSIDYSNFSKLKTLKSKYPKLKTVISVGGWDDSGMFSNAALTVTSRDTFADSVVTFLKTYGFDGVDIDWEYPTGGGLSSNVSRPADKTNFALLLQTLRSKLDAQGIIDNKHYILSFAGAANSTFASGVGLANIANIVDYGFIMTYDLHGGWDTYTDFNAPLYSPLGQSPQYKTSVDAAVQSWVNNGFPTKKIILGVPFYGYAYSGVTNVNNGLWQRFNSATTVGYNTIVSNYLSNPSFVKFSEPTSQVPWLFNGNTFVSYDDANSITAKAQYAVSKNMLGVGAWDISYDPNDVLINAIKNVIG